MARHRCVIVVVGVVVVVVLLLLLVTATATTATASVAVVVVVLVVVADGREALTPPPLHEEQRAVLVQRAAVDVVVGVLTWLSDVLLNVHAAGDDRTLLLLCLVHADERVASLFAQERASAQPNGTTTNGNKLSYNYVFI